MSMGAWERKRLAPCLHRGIFTNARNVKKKNHRKGLLGNAVLSLCFESSTCSRSRNLCRCRKYLEARVP